MPGFRRLRSPHKPLKITVGTVILLLGGWVAFAWLSASLGDRFESSYFSLAEAKKDGAVDRGWVPDDILPISTRNIHELHDLSPSREWCSFEFAPNDSERLRKSLKSIDVLPWSVRHVRNPKVPWWPTALNGNLDAQRIRNQGFDLYAIERPANSVQSFIMFFAVDWSRGRAFFYSTYK
jgi:hypothetical protein